jgi:hypothetical protein
MDGANAGSTFWPHLNLPKRGLAPPRNWPPFRNRAATWASNATFFHHSAHVFLLDERAPRHWRKSLIADEVIRREGRVRSDVPHTLSLVGRRRAADAVLIRGVERRRIRQRAPQTSAQLCASRTSQVPDRVKPSARALLRQGPNWGMFRGAGQLIMRSRD